MRVAAVVVSYLTIGLLAVVSSSCSGHKNGLVSSRPRLTTTTWAVPGYESELYRRILAEHGSALPVIASYPPSLSPTLQVSDSTLRVFLFHCGRVLPLNSPLIGNPPACAGDADRFGGFGSQKYTNYNSALHAADVLQMGETACSLTAGATIRLAPGVIGQELLNGPRRQPCGARWRSGHIEVTLFGLIQGLSANVVSIDSQLRSFHSTRMAVLTVDEAADGEHSAYAYVVGSYLVWATAVHSVDDVLQVAHHLSPLSRP